MRTISIFFGFVISLTLLTVIPLSAHAETRVTNGYLDNGATWTASSSPYILEDYVTVPYDHALSVEPGVVIDVDPAIGFQPDIKVYGAIFMNGLPDARITVKGVWGIEASQATATISYTDIHPVSYGTGLSLVNSHTLVSSSTISGAYQGIYVQSGSLDVRASRIENNTYGIMVEKYAPIFEVMTRPLQVASADARFGAPSDFPPAISSPLAPLLAQSTLPPPAIVTISNSSIVNNSSASIQNTEDNPAGTVQAIDNWWGSPDGPAVAQSSLTSGGTASIGAASGVIANSIDGLVTYTPWLDHDPTLQARKPKCCSSILFLPGIESSRLYRDEKGILGSGIGPGTSTNMLWEPNRNDDARKLFLDANGSSSDKTVYSGGAIDSAWGYGVYGKFMKFLDGLVSKGNVNEWNAFGYDWRKSIAEVVAGPEKKATTTVSLVQTLTDMAARSKTGKVTMIAHSNGGLVAKYLTKVLADAGKDNLIDSVISVAVPYLGTPEAVGGILHGDDEELAGGLLMNQSVARQLGQNMASAYSLLPSAMYFNAASNAASSEISGSTVSPIITFASSTPQSINNGAYPKSISSFSAESAFITDAKNVRKAPLIGDIQNPIEGNKALMASAGNLHDMLDLFSWPAHIARWAVVGWNALTTKSITYHASTKSTAQNPMPAHDTARTNMGDGTVVTRSASYDDGTTTNIDLSQLKKTEGKETLHGNILESVTAQNAIKGILDDSPDAAKERYLMSLPGVTVGPLDYSKERTYIQISTHSPIQPHVYDEQGNHTGEIPPPPDTEAGLWIAKEQNIPGSSFHIQATDNETDYETYISVPDDGAKYSVVLDGTGMGSFTFDIDRIRGGVTLDHAEYADLPVTPLTVATTTIQFSPTDIPTPPGVPFGIASSTFMKTIQPLSVDVDGDGTTDIQTKQGSTTDKIAYWESLKKSCGAVFGQGNYSNSNKNPNADKGNDSNSFCKGISNRIDHIEDLIKKGKFKKNHDFAEKIGQYFKHRRAKNLSDDDKREMGDMMDSFVSQFE